MTYLTQVTRWSDTDFQYRVGQSTRKSAQDITAESGATPNHANRVALATAVLNGVGPSEMTWAKAVVANDADYSGIDATADTALNVRIAAIWDGFAGTV